MYKSTLKLGMMLLLATLLLAIPVHAAENNAEQTNSSEETTTSDETDETTATDEETEADETTTEEETEVDEASTESNEEEAEEVTPISAPLSAYELEVLAVMEMGLVTQTPTEEANKCEVLQIMARAFKWTIDETATTDFTDVPEWCMPVAGTAFANGIVEGRTPTQLGLDSPVSRFEVAVMLHRELTRRNYEFTGSTERSFSDNLVDWAETAVNALVAEGIIKGFEDGHFGGTLGILKQDLGVMLLRLEMPTEKEEAEPEYIDEELVGSWKFVEASVNSETTLEASDASEDFIVTFDNQSRVTVAGDCNSIVGSYSVNEDQELSFGALAMTKMFCEDSVETEFSNHLTAAVSYAVSDNTLTLTLDKDSQEGSMTFSKE